VDVFALRDRLVADYEEFTRSLINVRDPRIDEVVDRELAEGLLWPESLIQLNPSFAPGATIDGLVAEGLLHEANRRSSVGARHPGLGARPAARRSVSTGMIAGCSRTRIGSKRWAIVPA
jgi:hypothetical protein